MSDGLKLISAIVASEGIGTLTSLDPAMLIDDERIAYDFVRQHFRTYRELPQASTVQAETGVRLPVANETLAYYVDRVNERYDYNLIRDRFQGLRDGLASRNMSEVSNTLFDMTRVLRRRRGGSSHEGSVIDLREGLTMVASRVQALRGTGGISGITTGWNKFDSITGGYQNADLITWVGRMGLGKTYVALRQAQKAHEAGENVLFVTTEMGAEQMARRYAALRLGLNPQFLRNGTISTYMERRIRSLASGVVGAERFKVFSVGMNSKTNAIEALCQEFGPTIVFIDGLYLLRPMESSKSMNRTERVSGVMDDLKGLTLEMNRPVVGTTQFNRAAGKAGRDGTLETIGFSDAIGTHSSIVVALKDGPSENPKESRTFDFLKGREGESGEVVINFKFAPLDMEETTADEVAEDSDGGGASVAWMGVRRRAE